LALFCTMCLRSAVVPVPAHPPLIEVSYGKSNGGGFVTVRDYGSCIPSDKQTGHFLTNIPVYKERINKRRVPD